MITDVYIVDDDPMLREKFAKHEFTCKSNPFYHFYDIGSMIDRSAAFKLKGSFGARQNPFAVVYDKDKAIKAFYSEAGDVYSDLINYLENYENL